MTVDCGEGKHDLCTGSGHTAYLIPQESRSPSEPPFNCACRCHRATRAEVHTCHAKGCDTHVPPKMFMCTRHWYMVPYGLRVAVWAEYQPGQEKLDGTAFPTDEYLEVTREAIDAVAAKEGF